MVLVKSENLTGGMEQGMNKRQIRIRERYVF